MCACVCMHVYVCACVCVCKVSSYLFFFTFCSDSVLFNDIDELLAMQEIWTLDVGTDCSLCLDIAAGLEKR